MDIHLNGGRKPQVLLLGNGILRLAQGVDWNTLIAPLNTRRVPEPVLDQLPMSMKPETMYGTRFEHISRHISDALLQAEPCVSPQLERLLALDFDCILTTNYTYEIEQTLAGARWVKSGRRGSFAYCGEGHPKQHNLQCCYLVNGPGGRQIPVWHVHGDACRSASLVLSYHSYVRAASHLFDYSRNRKNLYWESQQEARPIAPQSWFDWFLCGDVYSVGFGWNPCEVDLWWASERKSREKADVGRHVAYFPDDRGQYAQMEMLRAMGAEVCVMPQEGRSFHAVYDAITEDIRRRMTQASPPAPEHPVPSC